MLTLSAKHIRRPASPIAGEICLAFVGMHDAPAKVAQPYVNPAIGRDFRSTHR
jgi:hypothetical protein